MANITIPVAYTKGERLWFVYRKVGGWWIPTVSLWWQHTPKQSLSDPKALCHDNSLAVMTTVAIECVLLVVDWGLERQKACRLPRGMDTAHKRSAEVLWMMVS